MAGRKDVVVLRWSPEREVGSRRGPGGCLGVVDLAGARGEGSRVVDEGGP